MTDSEYIKRLFDDDAKTKKRIAHGEQNRVKATRKCTLPSDYMTATEKRRLNGTVATYDMGNPMKYGEFKKMPRDLQISYINGLREKYDGVSNKEIAEMMGASYHTFSKYVTNQLNIKSARGGNHKDFYSSDAYTRWVEFVCGEDKVVKECNGEAVAEDAVKVTEKESEEYDVFDLLRKVGKGKKITITITMEA